MILSFYSVIAGWALAYFLKMVQGVFVSIDASNANKIFEDFISDPIV